MTKTNWVEWIGTTGAVVLPFFNIPLILRLRQRKRSDDISLVWAIGVWVCILLMLPQSIRSTDPTFRSFGVINLLFFSVVVFFVLKYRKNPQ